LCGKQSLANAKNPLLSLSLFKQVFYSAFLSLHPFIHVDIFQLDFIRLKKCLISKKKLSSLSLSGKSVA